MSIICTLTLSLIQPFACTNSYLYSFVPNSTSHWNSLSQDVLNAPSFNLFKVKWSLTSDYTPTYGQPSLSGSQPLFWYISPFCKSLAGLGRDWLIITKWASVICLLSIAPPHFLHLCIYWHTWGKGTWKISHNNKMMWCVLPIWCVQWAWLWLWVCPELTEAACSQGGQHKVGSCVEVAFGCCVLHWIVSSVLTLLCVCGVKKSCSQISVEGPPWIFSLISGFNEGREKFH